MPPPLFPAHALCLHTLRSLRPPLSLPPPPPFCLSSVAPHPTHPQEGEGISHTAIREISLLRELSHESVVRLAAVHICRAPPSLSLAFDYADHDLHELICYHKDRLHGEGWCWAVLHWVLSYDDRPASMIGHLQHCSSV